MINNDIVAVVGPVCSGKSEFLINLYRKFKAHGSNVCAFKPVTDTRTDHINSRNGIE